MQGSESIKTLAKALVSASKEFEPIPKTAENPYYKSKYAPLDSVINATKDILSAHGLTVIQMPVDDGEGGIGLETVLMHESGEWLGNSVSFEIPYPTNKAGEQTNPIQEVGKNITYLRRYGLGALLNLAIEDDNDGSPPATQEERREQRENLKKKMAQMERPYNFGQLMELFAKNIEEAMAMSFSEQQRAQMVKVVGSHLTSIFDGDDTARYEYFQALLGVSSVKEMNAPTLYVIQKWLRVDGFDDEPDDMALAEISQTRADARKHLGQLELMEGKEGEE